MTVDPIYAFAYGATPTLTQINALIATASAAGGGIVQLPAGEIEIDLINHPNATGGFGKVGIVMRRGVTLRGAGRNVTTIKLVNAAALGTGSQNRVITNWDMDAEESGGDFDIAIEDLTVDGNAANVGSSTAVCHGIQPWRVNHVRVRNVIVKNCRGNDTSTYETFHICHVRCTDVLFEDCEVLTDDSGQTASGFSSNYGSNIRRVRCYAHDMANGHGFTCAQSDKVQDTDCVSEDNAGYGFNYEGSWDVSRVGNIATGNTTGGMAISTLAGGGRNQGRNNTYRLNGRGVGVVGSFAFTATTGTTGTTVVGPANTFNDRMVGRWLRVGATDADPWVMITGYTSDTTVTVGAAHGGASGESVQVMAGDLREAAIIESNTGGGLEMLDASAALKLISCFRTDFSDCRFDRNGNDCLGVGNGSTSTIARMGPKVTGTVHDNISVSGTIYRNPFPFRVLLVIVGSGVTEIGGKEPDDTTTDSVGANTWCGVVAPGGLFKPTISAATNVRFWPVF